MAQNEKDADEDEPTFELDGRIKAMGNPRYEFDPEAGNLPNYPYVQTDHEYYESLELDDDVLREIDALDNPQDPDEVKFKNDRRNRPLTNYIALKPLTCSKKVELEEDGEGMTGDIEAIEPVPDADDPYYNKKKRSYMDTHLGPNDEDEVKFPLDGRVKSVADPFWDYQDRDAFNPHANDAGFIKDRNTYDDSTPNHDPNDPEFTLDPRLIRIANSRASITSAQDDIDYTSWKGQNNESLEHPDPEESGEIPSDEFDVKFKEDPRMLQLYQTTRQSTVPFTRARDGNYDIKLRSLVEDNAADEAHKRGLTYAGWSNWKDSSGKIVARTENGQLVAVTENDPRVKVVSAAHKVAEMAHKGQFDKQGKPYLEHPVNVANRLLNEPPHVVAAALLHDSIEDNPSITPDVLRGYGIPEETINLVKGLTHPKGEPYVAYINRIAEMGREAILIKLADLAENTREDRRGNISPEDWKRREAKYLPAIAKLNSALPDNVLHEKLSGPKGTNPGGLYKGKDGKLRYVKQYHEEDQGRCEVIANGIYRMLGINAPQSTMMKTKNSNVYVSDIIEGATEKNKPFSLEVCEQILQGFLADVLMSNWDVLGLENDNILIDKQGKVNRIDNGSAFLYRAQGTPKPHSVFDSLPEWGGFRTSKINPNYAKVFSTLGITDLHQIKSELEAQWQRIRKIVEKTKGDWRPITTALMPNSYAAKKIGDIMNYRMILLSAKMKVL